MKSILYITVLATLIVSCTPKPIDIPVESAPPKIVVFSHAIPGEFMIISLTKSFSLLEGIEEEDYSTLLLSGATVRVVVDNQQYDFYEIQPGFYASYTPVVGDPLKFELFASHGDETVTAVTYTSEQVPFSNILPVVDKQAEDTIVRLQMSFEDPQGEENYYMINVYKNDPGTSFDGVNYFTNGNNLLEETILLSDKEFGATYSTDRTFSDLHHTDSIAVTLSNISKEYYNYLVLRNESGNLFNELNLEPLNYPTNINNGYGFFNAHIPDVRFYDLGEY